MYIATQEETDKIKIISDEIHDKYLLENGNPIASSMWTLLSPKMLGIHLWGDDDGSKLRKLLPSVYKDTLIFTMSKEQYELIGELRDKAIEELN